MWCCVVLGLVGLCLFIGGVVLGSTKGCCVRVNQRCWVRVRAIRCCVRVSGPMLIYWGCCVRVWSINSVVLGSVGL